MTKSTYYIVIVFSLLVQPLIAQVDSIQTNSNKLNIKNLKENKSRYLVYMENPDGCSLLNLSIWERGTKVTKDRIIVEQYWKTPESSTTRYVYSENDKSNFAPIYHYSKWGDKIDAFDFKENFAIGSDSIVNNRKQGFRVNYYYRPLNWELDLEIMQTLPYRLGRSLFVNFYDPGSKASPSAFYEYKVLRKEDIDNSFGGKTKCWVVSIDYDKEDKALFWVSTETKEVLKMVEHYKQFTRYKYKF